MKHDQNLCFECAYVGTCDGKAADDCDLMNLTEFETALNKRLETLNEQFSRISDVLKMKKEAFVEMYRKNPKISHDELVSFLQATNEVRVVHGLQKFEGNIPGVPRSVYKI